MQRMESETPKFYGFQGRSLLRGGTYTELPVDRTLDELSDTRCERAVMHWTQAYLRFTGKEGGFVA
jgi:hypothetical protein